MMNRLGLSSKVVQDRPLFEAIEIAARCGYAGLEFFGVPNHVPSDIPLDRVRELRRRIDDLNLVAIDLCSYVGRFAGLGDDRCEAELELARRQYEIANILGSGLVRLWADGLGSAPVREDHILRAAYYLEKAADLAVAADVKIILENHAAMTQSVAGTKRLLSLIDRPNVLINFDPSNMYEAGEDLDAASVTEFIPRIANVQVKDVSRRDGDGDRLLGEGDFDHTPILAALEQLGYQGYYCAECHKVPTADWPSDRIAAHEIEAMKELLSQATRGRATS
jgi:sugar phosphate isomerase/epimerase